MLHKYFEPKNYLTKSIQLLSILLKPLEHMLNKKFGEVGIRKYPPVFIIGAPRCGSTLLNKILTERYNFAFLSNFTAKLYLIPTIGSWLQKKIKIQVPKGNYDFNYGQVNGLGSPNECGEFWYRWFPRGLHVYVGKGQTEEKALRKLRAEIGSVSHTLRAPMIFKNLYNSMRIAPILEAIPEARFIVCRRNSVDCAMSILKGRILNLKKKDVWWSTPPKEVDELMKMDYAKQVAGQVHFIYKQIEVDKNVFGNDKFFEIRYEKLCEDVHGTIQTVEKFLNKTGNRMVGKYKVPSMFEIMDVKGINADDRVQIENAYRFFCNR
jgi:hypothetical protein